MITIEEYVNKLHTTFDRFNQKLPSNVDPNDYPKLHETVVKFKQYWQAQLDAGNQDYPKICTLYDWDDKFNNWCKLNISQ